MKNYKLFCSYCDSRIDEEDKVCLKCGAPTKSSSNKEINELCVCQEWLKLDEFGVGILSNFPKTGVTICSETNEVIDTIGILNKKIKIKWYPNQSVRVIYAY